MTNCYCPIEKGGLNLKNFQIQADALILNRMLKCFCDFEISLTCEAFSIIIHFISVSLPIHIREIKDPMKTFAVYFVEIVYASVGAVPWKRTVLNNCIIY